MLTPYKAIHYVISSTKQSHALLIVMIAFHFFEKWLKHNFDKQYIWQSGMLGLSLFDCLSMS